MKKQLLLLAGGALLLLSCGSNYKQSNIQLIIDSAVNAKVAAHDAANARKNDSIINAAAKIKAEAMQSELDMAKKMEETKTINTSKTAPDSLHK